MNYLNAKDTHDESVSSDHDFENFEDGGIYNLDAYYGNDIDAGQDIVDKHDQRQASTAHFGHER